VALVAGAHFSQLAVDLLAPITIPYAMFLLAFGGERFRAAAYGDFSYGTYLYAFPIQQLLVAETRLAFPVYVAVAMSLSLLAGVASWFAVERWFHRSARPNRERAIAKACANAS